MSQSERTLTVSPEEARYELTHRTLVLTSTIDGVATPVGCLIVERDGALGALDATFADAIAAGLSDFALQTVTSF